MDPMTEFEQELDRALAVRPSADFAARVRTGLASEPTRQYWPLARMAWAAAGAVIILAALTARPPRVDDVRVSRDLIGMQHASAAWAPLRAGVRAMPPASSPAPSPAPSIVAPGRIAVASSRVAVIVAPSEMAALRRLFSGTYPLVPLPTPVTDELVIAAIAIEPIAFPTNSEGDGQ